MALAVAGRKRPFAAMADAASDWDTEPGVDAHEITVPPLSSATDSWRRPATPVQVGTSQTTQDAMGSKRIVRSAVSSPAPLPPAPSTVFEPDASLVLTGIRGVGKSTLAIMAASAMKRRVIDAEKVFLERTGLSSPAYKNAHGIVDLQQRQADVLQAIFLNSPKHAIIVCSWMERRVQVLLRELCRTNPIIYIVRDADAIRGHLKLWDESKVRDLVDASGSVFRTCTHFEFFNVSEQALPAGNDAVHAQAPPERTSAPYLTLKRAERHFLKFLSLILPTGSIPFAESAFPLASVLTEERRFTYSVSITVSELGQGNPLDVEELEAGADAIEIVVDDLVCGSSVSITDREHGHLSARRATEISRAVAHVRRSTVVPVFLHIVFPEEATENQLWKSLYMSYVLHGLRLAPEYLSVDVRLDDDSFSHISAAKGATKLIGNLQLTGPDSKTWDDPLWLASYHKAQRRSCDLVRFTRTAIVGEDSFSVNNIRLAAERTGQPRIPLIAYSTGRLGKHSACMNQILTSVIPWKVDITADPLEQAKAAEIAEDENARWPKPSLSAREATGALYASFLYDPMKLYVFGANVDYSLSPAMHNKALEACGIPHYYRPHSAPSIRAIRDLIYSDHFAGASVGLPFKVEIISLTHSLSRHARAIGAANTLIPIRCLRDDGTIPEDALLFNQVNRAGPIKALYGENTDWIGIRACLRRGLSPANAVRSSSCALVIGAGGMARAAVYAILQLGVENIVVFNRTHANAEKMVEHFSRLLSSGEFPLLSTTSSSPQASFHILGSRNEPWPASFRQPTMVVSCIPTHSIGDSPAPEFTLPPEWMKSPTGGVLVELAYKTLNTPLLEQFRREASRGWITMDGLDLLPEQGFAQFELFTGRRAPRRIMRREVFRSYPDDQGRSNRSQLQPRLNNVIEQAP